MVKFEVKSPWAGILGDRAGKYYEGPPNRQVV